MDSKKKLGIITHKTNDMCHRFHVLTNSIGSEHYAHLTEEEAEDLFQLLMNANHNLQFVLRRLDKYNII